MARLWRAAARRLPVGAFVLALGASVGGCSFSYQLDSLFGKGGADEITTGSIKPVAAAAPMEKMPSEGDLVVARAAVTEILAKGGKDTSMPWENPKTGARGTVTPIATSYAREDGATCRDFLASYIRDGTEAWLHGEACRQRQGKWEVRNLKPWKRT